MQRFINDPDRVVEDTLKGFVKAHADTIRLSEVNSRVVVARQAPVSGKVGIITGGGSGHEPAFLGYTGRNMLDAVAVGELFSSPTAKSFLDAAREANGGKGIVCLYGNYAGDNMNVKMAIKLAAKEGIEIATVVANDDVCSASPEEREKRRGVAGEIFMWKCGGAMAAEGASLEDVRATAQKAIDSCRSIGIGLGPCTLPAVGHPNFTIEPGTMEVGIGHHGEPGVRVEPLKSAAEVGKEMANIVLDDHDLPAETEVAVLVSGLGATPLNELYILNDAIESEISARGLKIHKTYVGNYFTSLEMVGATLTVMRLDAEFKRLLDLDVQCPARLL
jgi:phosphoenolpyruvate---glycerone phosphotransferase subunit DhaK